MASVFITCKYELLSGVRCLYNVCIPFDNLAQFSKWKYIVDVNPTEFPWVLTKNSGRFGFITVKCSFSTRRRKRKKHNKIPIFFRLWDETTEACNDIFIVMRIIFVFHLKLHQFSIYEKDIIFLTWKHGADLKPSVFCHSLHNRRRFQNIPKTSWKYQKLALSFSMCNFGFSVRNKSPENMGYVWPLPLNR